MNRRIAEHRSRIAHPVHDPETPGGAHNAAAGGRAAEAAARVAARFANAPSYSEMLAEEARAAVRAAEFASRAALHAQAAAESVLAGLEAASAAQFAAPVLEAAVAKAELPAPAAAITDSWDAPSASPMHWEPRPVPALRAASASALGAYGALGAYESLVELPAEQVAEKPGSGKALCQGTTLVVPQMQQNKGRALAPAEASSLNSLLVPCFSAACEAPAQIEDAADERMQFSEASQPAHANLIEFPRELVATRKVRPRIAEGPYGALHEPGSQLSIFEVDPDAVSTMPTLAVAEAAAPSVSPWTQPEWSGIELAAQPAQELVLEDLADLDLAGQDPAARDFAAQGFAAQDLANFLPQNGEVKPAPALELAPMSRRLLAAVTDGALITAAFLAAAFAAACNARTFPGPRQAELAAAAALLVIAALYQTLFFTLGRVTPGMKYARIGLSTFTGQRPTRRQRTARLIALLLSVLPVGLGLVWSAFDEDNLSWHDRLSQTYLRRC